MKLFYELVQIGIGTRCSFSSVPSSNDWTTLFAASQKQSLVGICFQGINLMYHNEPEMVVNFPGALKMKWMAMAVDIQRRNSLILERARELSRLFAGDGYRSTVLKGVGVSKYYPDPSLRQGGDIDLWVDAPRGELISYLRTKYKVGSVVVHHADVEIFTDVETEIHFWPSYTYNPFRWLKYRSFFDSCRAECFVRNGDGYCSPSFRFNSVYLMMHIFRHIYNEGIGLRQLLDYYYLLRKLSSSDRVWAMSTLRKMGLGKFTAAVMCVIREVFLPSSQSLTDDNDFLLCSPDEKSGRFLLNEIELAGNFGKWDKRLHRRKGYVGRVVENLNRLATFFSLSPSEVLWAPVWKAWHWCWRKVHRY